MRNYVVRTGKSLSLALRALLVLGVLYPGAVWAIGRAMPSLTNGSFIYNAEGEVVGSRLIGQAVTDERLFYPRPSLAGAKNEANAGDDGYDPMSSGASNLAATSDVLAEQIQERKNTISKREGVDPAAIPADAVTASGSGLDPHISPEYAKLQIPRVARNTGLDEGAVARLVGEHTSAPIAGFLSQPVGNTVTLNAAVLQALN